MDSRKCQTVTVSPAKPGGFPLLDNVGKTIALRDFDRERDDLSPLAQALSAGGRDGESLLDAILGWSGGHPFLTLQLCQDCLQRGMDSPQAIDRFANYDKALVEENFQEHFQQITNFLDQRLANQGRTLALYQRILLGRKVADGPSRPIIELKLSGLIRRDDHGRLVVRNRIYRKIFDADWVRGTKPLRTVRYLAWTSAIAVTLILAWGVWWGYDSLYLEPERREVARLIEEIDRTQDPEQAERFAGYLRGEHADPGLGRVIRGQQAVAAAALTRFRRRKEQAIGRDLLTALEETADKAKDLFQWLAGQRPPPELGRPLRGFEAQADEGYQAFWERRADKLEKSAQVRLAAGHLDEALILAAAAARKTQRPVSAGFRNAFVAKGYGRLFRTMRSGRSYLGHCEVAISPQGDLVADGRGGVWEIATGQLVEKLRWESGTGIGVDFSPDQGLLAISNDDGRASVWKTTDWTQKRELTLGPEVEGIKSVYEIEFSRDGKSLATAYWDWDQDRQLWVWDTHTWERTNRLTDIGIFPLGLAFFPDSGRVAVASRQDIKTWDLGPGDRDHLTARRLQNQQA